MSAISTTSSLAGGNISFDNLILKKNLSSDERTMVIISNNTIAPNSGSNTIYSYELPTESDYSRGYMYRYFYKPISDENSLVQETSKLKYSQSSEFYLLKFYKIKWKIVGDKEETRKINENNSILANDSFKGIKSVLSRDYTLYWKNLPDSQLNFNVTPSIKQPILYTLSEEKYIKPTLLRK